MNEASELQGNISNQMNLEYLANHANVFFSPELGVVLTGKGTRIPAGQHVHDSYEFLMPIDKSFSAMVSETNCTIRANALFPINSEQFHGPATSVDNFHCLALDIKKECLCGISQTLFGREDLSFQNTNFPISDNIKLLTQLFMDEHKNKQTGYSFIMQNLANAIMVDLLRNYHNNKTIPALDKKYLDKHNIHLVRDFLNENFRNEYSLDDISKIANYSPYHLIRVFKDTTGQTPYGYLMQVKITAAKTLLKNTNKSIMEICYACGFNNPNHFTHVFKRGMGITPTKYRKTCNF